MKTVTEGRPTAARWLSLIAVSALCSSPAHVQSSSIALVQHAGKDAGTITSSSLAFPASNTAGNFIAVVVRVGRSSAVISVNDTSGNLYRQAAKLDVTVDAPSGDTLAIFYAESIRAGANTVTVSSSLGGASLRLAILEYSGVARSSSLDGTASAQGTNSTPASGSTTTTANGDLVLGAVMTADASTFTPGSGFTLREQVSAKLMAEDRIQTSAGPASAGATLVASNPWGAMVAAFRAAPSVAQPDLTLTKTHTGTFVRGQSAATYTLTVTNIGSAASAGTVTVTDTVPAGLTATGMGGAGWSCTLATTRCTRGDVLAASGSYPPITLTVSVAANAPSSVTNTASVSGGGDLNTGNNTASDVTPIGSGADTQSPTAPGGLTATATAADRIDLNWTASTDNVGVTGYRVEQCQGTACTNFTEIARIVSAPAGMGPLTASANPNYFKDASGKPLILNGSHTWNDLQDWGTNGSPQPLDFNAFVNFLVAHEHNFTLLWYIELPKFCGWPSTAVSPPDFTIGPHPWQRTGPGLASDGGPRFDLTKLNQAFFDRLRARAQALNAAGIYVGVYTFTAEWVWRYRCPTDGYPFTGSNNINGIDDGGGVGTFTMTSPNAITAIQDTYVEKVIDTLNDLPNVLWIVSEEAPPGSDWWNAHQIAHIRSYESTKPFRHPIGFAVIGDGGDTTLFNSNADWVAGVSRIAPTTSCGSGTPPCKVNVNDSDHSYFGIWNDSAQVNRNYAWRNFTNGNQVMFMDPYDVYYPRENRNLCTSPTNGICTGPDPRWENFRDNLGDILRYSRKLNLANVTPRGSLTSTSNCLAQTPSVGAEYLIYAPNGGSFTVNLSAMPSSRTLNVEWFNPSTGATTVASPIAAGSPSQAFTPPFSGDAVLYLVDAAGHAGSPLPTSYSVTGLAPGTYRYRVRAEDASGNLGPYSNVASATLSAISLVQHRGLDAGSAASSSLAFTTTNTAGNLIVVAIRSAPSSQALTVMDTRGNIYRKATQLNETVDGIAVAIYYAENIAGGANTVTVSKPQSGGTLRFAILEYSGVALTGSLDGTAGAQGASATPTSGTVTPTSSGELVIGVVATANERTFTAGAGYVIKETVPAAPNTKLIVEDRTQATASSLSAGATLSSSDYWAAVVATFRAR